MRFFSKFTFICNLSFLAYIILRMVEIGNQKKGYANDAIQLKPLESSLVILGMVAIFVNIAFNATVLISFILKKQQAVAKWLIWLNFLFLLAQVYYFFL